MAFAVMSFSQLVHAFNMRSEHSVFRIGLLSNRKMVGAFLICAALQISVLYVPFLNAAFGTVRLTGAQSRIVAWLSLVPLMVCEIEKYISQKKMVRKQKRLVNPQKM